MSDIDPAALEAALAQADAGTRKLIQTVYGGEMAAPWVPEPTNQPQSDAYHSKADVLLYGGAAGGGKSDLLLGLSLTAHRRSVIFRRTYVDLNDMERRLIAIRGTRSGYNSVDMALQADGRVIEFGALERPGSELTWQGRPHDFIGFDEGAQLPESKVRFVMGWLRSEDPEQRCRVVIASNPPIGAQGEWLITWFAPWARPGLSRSGQAGRAALALHARGRLDGVGGRARRAHDRRQGAARDLLHVHPGAALRQPLPARHPLPGAAD